MGRRLTEHGLQPIFALQNLVETWPLYRDDPFPVLQAPVWRQPGRRKSRPFLAATYCDILAIQSYSEVDQLLPVVRGWDALLASLRPSLVIADHSPTLCLAAYRRLPVVLMGTGFVLPPAHLPTFPTLVPGVRPVLPQEQVLEVVQQVQKRENRPVPATLPSILAGDARFLTIWPEVDPYAEHRVESHSGPLEVMPPLTPSPKQKSFFAYLTIDETKLEIILTGLSRSGLPGQAFVRGADAPTRKRLRRLGLPILDKPLPMDEVAASHSLIVHHGGAGTAHSSLAAGRPQVLLPQHIEHACTAQRLHRLGLAHYIGQVSVQAVIDTVQVAMHDNTMSQRAIEVATVCQQRAHWRPLEAIVDACVRLTQ